MAKLNLYEVQHRGHTAVMKLSDEDAQAFKDRDGLAVKKVGASKPAAREDVVAPPYAVDEDGKDLPEAKSGTIRTRARQVRNK